MLVAFLVQVSDLEWISPKWANVRQKHRPNFESEEFGLVEDFKVCLTHHASQFVFRAVGCVNVSLEVHILAKDSPISFRLGGFRVIYANRVS